MKRVKKKAPSLFQIPQFSFFYNSLAIYHGYIENNIYLLNESFSNINKLDPRIYDNLEIQLIRKQIDIALKSMINNNPQLIIERELKNKKTIIYKRYNEELIYLNGKMNFAIGNYDLSIAQFKKLLHSPSLEVSANGMLALVSAYFAKKEFNTGLEYLENIKKNIYSKKEHLWSKQIKTS